MQRNECKPGTKVIIRGTVREDDESQLHPIIVDIHGSKREEIRCFDPSQLEPALPKYDPARKYCKGDLVRITGFHGRLFGCGNVRKLSEDNKIGDQVTLCGNEDFTGDVALPDGVLTDRYSYLSVACIELVKPIEEIEAEEPYCIEEADTSFDVCLRVTLGVIRQIYCVFFGDVCGVTQEEARRKAQELCNELNRKHRESLDA